jgi:AcrR family transcriptional regulator
MMQGIGGKPAAIRRNNQYQRRLQSILRAASRVIARDGFEGASVRDVAARAKIGLSGLYYYFTNKEELLYALQHHTFTTLIHSLEDRLEDVTAPEERLQVVIDNHFEFFARHMDELKVCVHEIESLSGKQYRTILAIRKRYYRLVRGVVAENMSRDKSRADVATLYLFGALNWVYMWYDADLNADIGKLSAHYGRLFLNGLRTS